MTRGITQQNFEVVDLFELKRNGTSISIFRQRKAGDSRGEFERTKYFITPPITDDEMGELQTAESPRSIPSLVGKLLKLGPVTSGDTTSFTREGQVSTNDTEAGIELAKKLMELRGQRIAEVTTELIGQDDDARLVLAK